MNCRGFERLLEPFVAGGLSIAEAEDAERHVGGCRSCAELLKLARIATPADAAEAPPEGLVEEVLRHTAGPACPSVESVLCDLVDGELADARAELVESHLSRCSGCRDLASVLPALASDLPSLADIRPDARFVDAVLAATLPWHVRLARWWRRGWPRWVRRPRFAAEAAYVTTLIVVLIVSTPGSPLEAMPRRAAELARRAVVTQPGSGLWTRLEATLATRFDALRSSRPARTVVGGWTAASRAGSNALERTVEAGGEGYGWAVQRFRTFRQWLASVLEEADDTPSAAEREPDEETK